MGQDKKTPIVIDDVEYQYEDLSQEQQMLFNHCVDLDRKIGSAMFNLDQLNVVRQTFTNMLKEALNKPKEVLDIVQG